MEIQHECCCGLDVHKKTVVACLLTASGEGKRRRETRTFLTMTEGLLQLLDWLKEQGCTHVAMEATGVYWRPIYNILEGEFELLVVNAHHMKAVPGRKTDVKDAEWIADLLQHGLLKASFVPDAEQRGLRDLTRYRTTLVEERARVVNRLQKTLEDTNLKLGDVVSDILGKSSKKMLKAMIAGEQDPAVIARLAEGRLKAKQSELEAACRGTLQSHHRFLLNAHLEHITALDQAIDRVSTEIAARLGLLPPPPDCPPGSDLNAPSSQSPLDPSLPPTLLPPQTQQPVLQPVGTASESNPADCPLSRLSASDTECLQDVPRPPLTWDRAVALLITIPGIGQRAAEGILAEIGLDMGRFQNAKRLASWAGVCPGNHESAGKRMSGRTNKGNPWLRKLLIQSAQAAAHTKDTYLSAQYRRLAGRRGKKKATMALAHTLLTIIFHVLKEQEPYSELGSDYFEKRNQPVIEMRLVQRLEKLGYNVSLSPTEKAA